MFSLCIVPTALVNMCICPEINVAIAHYCGVHTCPPPYTLPTLAPHNKRTEFRMVQVRNQTLSTEISCEIKPYRCHRYYHLMHELLADALNAIWQDDHTWEGGGFHAAFWVHAEAGRFRPAPGRGGHARGGGVPQDGDQRADLLPLEEAASGDGCGRGEAAAGRTGGETQGEAARPRSPDLLLR